MKNNQSHPNIMLIVSDELRADALGCYGSTICKTPELDRFASQAALFTDCNVTQPTCTPSRASMLTGCFPSALRSRMVGCHTPDDPRFLPRVFRQAGYETASVGKIHMVPSRVEHDAVAVGADGELDYYGFQHVDLVDSHGVGDSEYLGWLNQKCPNHRELRKEAPKISPGVNNDTGSLRTMSWTLPRLRSTLENTSCRGRNRSSSGRRSLPNRSSSTSPFPIHTIRSRYQNRTTVYTILGAYRRLFHPFARNYEPQLFNWRRTQAGGSDSTASDRLIGTPPHDYSQLTIADWQASTAIYYGMISLMDAQVGRLLQSLEDSGLSDNTIVAFVSDHGEYMGDHGMCGKGFHYDSVTRTPLLLRGPGIGAGRRINGVASIVDLAPTLLSLGGVAPPDAMQGVSMAGAILGDESFPRDAVLTENDDDFVPMRMRTLTTSDWKLTWYCGEEEGELYDRRADPGELVNRWTHPSCQSIRDGLTHRLLEHVVCALDSSNGRTQVPAPQLATFTPRKSDSTRASR